MTAVTEEFEERLQTRAVKTQRLYSMAVGKFARWVRRQGFEIEAVIMNPEDFNRLAQGWVSYLISRGLSPSTVRCYFAGVRKLARASRILLDVELPGAVVVEEKRLPTREMLARLIPAQPKYRAYYLLLVSSGLRPNAALGLSAEDVWLDVYEDVAVVRVPATLSKNKRSYVTFVTPETKEALRSYMAQRNGATKIFGLDYDSVYWKWNQRLEKCGYATKGKRFNVYRLSCLRNYFRTMLFKAGVSDEAAEAMMGHRLPLAGVYTLASDEWLAERYVDEYRKAVPLLTIYGGGGNE